MTRSTSAVAVAVALIGLSLNVTAAEAAAPSGAIFTTLADGSEVNYNIYQSKESVYLDGGPGVGAPQDAAGLDDGEYVFQVTDPSGKTLLSQDPGVCRLVLVQGGVISAVSGDPSCSHVTGVDVDHGAVTVQLMPYADTPNAGGVYKVWMTQVSDYTCPLGVVDCGNAGSSRHGFVPSASKTDNFKVKGLPHEIDTRFYPSDHYGRWLDGLGITHVDPLGASNVKWSYLDEELDVNHEAHVEAVEKGTHLIRLADQTGCAIGTVIVAGKALRTGGPQDVAIRIDGHLPRRGDTVFVDVECH